MKLKFTPKIVEYYKKNDNTIIKSTIMSNKTSTTKEPCNDKKLTTLWNNQNFGALLQWWKTQQELESLKREG